MFSSTEEFKDSTGIDLHNEITIQKLVHPYENYYRSLRKYLSSQLALTHVLKLKIHKEETQSFLFKQFSYIGLLLGLSQLMMLFTLLILIPQLRLTLTQVNVVSYQRILGFSLGFEWAILFLIGGFITLPMEKKHRLYPLLKEKFPSNLSVLWVTRHFVFNLFKLSPHLDFKTILDCELRFPSRLYHERIVHIQKMIKDGSSVALALNELDDRFIRLVRLNQFDAFATQQIEGYLSYSQYRIKRQLMVLKQILQAFTYTQLALTFILMYQLVLSPLKMLEDLS